MEDILGEATYGKDENGHNFNNLMDLWTELPTFISSPLST
jgi:hypothetical protein